MKKLLVGICTKNKNRHRNLKKTLNSIINLKRDKFFIKIIVIENGPKKTLKLFFRKIKKRKNIKIYYYNEKKIGIPYARNKVLKILKLIKGDYIAFVDDDCILDKNWLFNMYNFIKRNDVDIVTGPQISLSKKNYIRSLDRIERHKTYLDWAATNNVFCKKKILASSNIKFNESMANTGGSDQLFFRILKKRGYKIMWNANSKIYEFTQKNRENLKWFILRSFRYGLSSYLIYKNVFGIIPSIFYVLLKCSTEFLRSFIYLILIFINPQRYSFLFIQNISKSIGSFLSLMNFKLKKYY